MELRRSEGEEEEEKERKEEGPLALGGDDA
jgi:hypothetical protein